MKTVKYVVKKEFLDRFDGMRHCKPGEAHVPPSEERAKQLVELGYIVAYPEQENETRKPEKSSTKVTKPRGDANVEQDLD